MEPDAPAPPRETAMNALVREIAAVPRLRRFGRVARIEGLLVEVTGAVGAISMGGQAQVYAADGQQVPCEVVGFREGRALLMPLGSMHGVALGARADFEDHPLKIYPNITWLGRVLDAFAAPTDGKGRLIQGAIGYPIKAAPPAAPWPWFANFPKARG